MGFDGISWIVSSYATCTVLVEAWVGRLLHRHVLVSAVPSLSCVVGGSASRFKLPCVGWTSEESIIAAAYQYTTACVTASDQYLDCMATAIALSCGWQYAHVMLWVFFGSLVLQGVAGGLSVDGTGVVLALTGSHPESIAAFGDSNGNSEAFAASQGVTKLVTENVPQSYLSIKFALDVKPSQTVWFSVALSLALATKSFIGAVAFYCKKYDYAALPRE